MATLLQLHFAFNGPFGDAMAEQLKPLAESINQEPGFLWKVWTESEKNHEAGGIEPPRESWRLNFLRKR